MFLNNIFYTIKPFIPRRLQIFVRRQVVRYKRTKYSHIWPIDPKAGTPPEGWQGWPDNKKFALVLSHDVDTQNGHDKCYQLMELEERLGVRSSFNFVPERYTISKKLLKDITERGFQVCVHGLKHDGKLFSSRKIFERRSIRINQYIKEWDAKGFTTPSMLRNPEWIHDLNVTHCTSTFDTDPFEPQPHGIKTIYPFYMQNKSSAKGFIELPYTLPQDFTLFILMKEKTINIWKKKLDWIAQHGGMAMLNTHPDYMRFNTGGTGDMKYPVKYYADFLEYVKKRYEDRYFFAKPSEIADFYKQQYLLTSALKLSTPQPPQPNQLNQLNQLNELKHPINHKKPKAKPAHILFIVENNTVPTDIRVWREAKVAKQIGYEVSIISPKNKRYQKNYEIIESIEIYRHPVFNCNGGKLNQIFEYVNAFFWETLLCLRVLIRNPFDIIHCANPPDHLFLLGAIFKIYGIKYIFDHHDLAPELFICKFNGEKGIVYNLLCLMEKLSCQTANVIITTNESYQKHVIDRHKLIPEKIYIVRNDPELPKERKKIISNPSDSNNVIKLLYVGTINIQDGVDLLIEAVNILVKELNQRQVFCTIIGDGDHLSKVKNLCVEFGIQPYFDFKGFIYNRKMVKKYIEEADICLETAPDSEVNRKSTFIKIMEYMAAGKPIVAFDLDETRYSTNNSAILVEPGNTNLFAKAIERLIKDPVTREKLGKSAQNRIFEKLNWQVASQQLINAYKAVTLF